MARKPTCVLRRFAWDETGQKVTLQLGSGSSELSTWQVMVCRMKVAILRFVALARYQATHCNSRYISRIRVPTESRTHCLWHVGCASTAPLPKHFGCTRFAVLARVARNVFSTV
jgi:hypothetical protein